MYPLSTRLAIALLATLATASMARPPAQSTSWLDATQLVSWNVPAASVPAAPRSDHVIDPRCRALARPTQLEEDRQIRDRGWDLVGTFLGGWGVLVLLGTADYDPMCRPRQYQGFVFVNGAFAGTLSPQPMDSRSDGAPGQVTIQGRKELIAEYARYADSDPLCCPSRQSIVSFEIVNEPAVVRPVAVSTN